MLKKGLSYITERYRAVWIILAVIIGLAVSYFFIHSIKPFRGKEARPFIVRIRVVHNADEIELSADSICRLAGEEVTGRTFQEDAELKDPTIIAFYNRGMKIDGVVRELTRLRISVPNSGTLFLNRIEYRGEMDIIRTSKGLDVINRVELEDYLKGVLPREVSHFWPFAALEAQAVVSRTFTVSQALRRKNKSYDMTADTFSQVYGGKTSERWRTNRAVERTKGKVLEYEGEVIPAYFHSCCGGHTQDAFKLWSEDILPLKGVKCSWCRWSPHFRWQVRIPTKVLVKKLIDAGYNIKRIDNIKNGTRDISGRLEYVSIKSGSKWFDIKGWDFSKTIGRNVIKSTNMRIKKYPFFYYFSGYGWGHGVGMCQWGAFGLALRWWSADRILRHYYPGTEIASLTSFARND